MSSWLDDYKANVPVTTMLVKKEDIANIPEGLLPPHKGKPQSWLFE